MLEPSGAQHAPPGSSLLLRVLDERLCGTSGTGQYAAHSLLLRFALCALVGGGGVAGEGRAPGLLLALIESGQTEGCSLSYLLLFL